MKFPPTCPPCSLMAEVGDCTGAGRKRISRVFHFLTKSGQSQNAWNMKRRRTIFLERLIGLQMHESCTNVNETMELIHSSSVRSKMHCEELGHLIRTLTMAFRPSSLRMHLGAARGHDVETALPGRPQSSAKKPVLTLQCIVFAVCEAQWLTACIVKTAPRD